MFELPEDLPLDSDIFEEGLDSMGLMQLILVLENEFEISFEVNDLAKENFQNIGSISALVTRKLNHLAP